MNTTARYPVMVIWYLVVFVCSAALLAVQAFAGISNDFISIVQFAPTLALLAFVPALRSARSVTARDPRAVFVRRMLVGIGVFGAYAAILVGGAAAFDALRTSPAFGTVAALCLYLVLQLAGAIGEEIGWRGYLQPALETRMSRTAAACVVGVAWAVWHVEMMTDVVTAVAFTAACIALSVLFAHIVGGSVWQRGLIGGVMHCIVNVAIMLPLAPGHPELALFPLPFLLAGAGVVALVRRRSSHQAAAA